MYINASIQNDTGAFRGVGFTMENFENFYVDESYIDGVEMLKSDFVTENDCDTVFIIFNSNFRKKEKRFFDRLNNIHDVTYVDLYFKDSKERLQIMVPYEEDEYGLNKLQSMKDNLKTGGNILSIDKKGGLLQ